MRRYIGCDTHSKSCTFGVLGPSGRRLQHAVVETNGRDLITFIRGIPGERHLCVEEGEQAQWLVELLSRHVHELAVIQPERRLGCKDDKRDAFELAEILQTGRRCRRVFKDPGRFQGVREASRVYTMLTGDVVRIKNRIKSFYRGRGVPVGGSGPYRKSQRHGRMQDLPGDSRTGLDLLYQELDHVEGLKKRAKADLLQEARCHSVTRILETAPGIGPVRAAQLLPIVVTPHRFRTRQQFWAYCGLAVVTRSSSDWARIEGHWVRAHVAQTRGLNHNRNPKLKEIFKGASVLVCTRMTQHPLHGEYQRLLEKGLKPSVARVTMARRIAAIVLAMWKHEQPYDPSAYSPKNDPV